MTFAARLVELHDAEGMPLELTLQMAREGGRRVPLLGLLAGMAQRGWGKAAARQAAEHWRANFAPTAGEALALERLAT